MRSVGIFEVKTKLSELLRLGEPIEVTSHRKRVAVIYPNHAPLDQEQVKRDIKALNEADKQDDTTGMGDYL
ncbi:MAG: hypothetical protein IPI17_15300 [Nitrosomonas sp.]|jgi:antitoxin (DNA-binding transcriptional repressor) of toxin-antitoxin stability system|nr:hypothetical protein [Nitrosomonas sp.]MBS0497187.1 hypothetical protein [Pseudomonadota bacterium]